MKRFFRVLLGIGLLVIGVIAAKFLAATKPEADTVAATRPVTKVDVQPVVFQPFQIELPSQGLIDARHRTVLASEVSGRIIEVSFESGEGESQSFDVGQAYRKGDILLKIDPTDYRAAMAEAWHGLSQAMLELETEGARAVQAKRDWIALKREGEPSRLTLRKPQVESAARAIASAQAKVIKAATDLVNTEIKAPFDGVISKVELELGAYVNAGNPVAEFYSVAPWEIRLPLALNDFSLVKVTEEGEVEGEAVFRVFDGPQERQWSGSIARVERQVDRESRSVYLVAELPGDISDPLLQPGLFVRASIEGRKLENVASIPFRAFTDLTELAVVSRDGKIEKRNVDVIRRFEDNVLISGGVEDGEWICLTQLSDMVEGMPVEPTVIDSPTVLTGEPSPKP